MARAAVEFYGHPSHELTVAGVTGTNGKTTTCFLLFAILAAAGRRPGLLGTIENRVGGERRPALRTTPEAIDVQRSLREMLDAGDRSCAMEATSHGAQLGRLAGVRFSALAFTNLSRDHLDFHGTLEQYFEAKRSLFVNDDPPPAALNADDPHGRRLASELRALGHEHVITFGFGRRHIHARISSWDVTVRSSASQASRCTRLLGRFNVENVLAAVAVARLLELPKEAIVRGIESVRGVPGRFEAVEGGQPFSVVVDTAHTPDSLEDRSAHGAGAGNGPRDLRVRVRWRSRSWQASAHGRRGGGRCRRRDRHLRQPAQRRSPGGRRRDHAWARLRGRRGADRARAIERAIETARAGDVVLVAGKGHEQGQETAGETLPFDDREVAGQALRRLAART